MILIFVSDTAFCLFVIVFSLVSDRLGGQVSEQKVAGTLVQVQKPRNKISENADSVFCTVTNVTLQLMQLKIRPVHSLSHPIYLAYPTPLKATLTMLF